MKFEIVIYALHSTMKKKRKRKCCQNGLALKILALNFSQNYSHVKFYYQCLLRVNKELSFEDFPCLSSTLDSIIISGVRMAGGGGGGGRRPTTFPERGQNGYFESPLTPTFLTTEKFNEGLSIALYKVLDKNLFSTVAVSLTCQVSNVQNSVSLAARTTSRLANPTRFLYNLLLPGVGS